MLDGGRGSGRILLYGTLACGVLFAGLNSVPGADRVVQRFETLGHMQDDGSFQGRLGIFHDTWPAVISNPAGFGIGSSGTAGRLNVGGGVPALSDNGWLVFVALLGRFWFALFVVAFAILLGDFW